MDLTWFTSFAFWRKMYVCSRQTDFEQCDKYFVHSVDYV